MLIFRAVYFRIPAGSFWGGEIWSCRVSRNQLSQRNPVIPQPHESRERSSHAQAQVSRLSCPSRTVAPAKWKQSTFTSLSNLPVPQSSEPSGFHPSFVLLSVLPHVERSGKPGHHDRWPDGGAPRRSFTHAGTKLAPPQEMKETRPVRPSRNRLPFRSRARPHQA